MKFKASLDKFTKTTSFLVSILLLTIILLQFIGFKSNNFWVPVFTTIFIVVSFIITLLYKPNSYTLQSNQLIIHRYIKNVIISKSEIKSAEQIEREILKYSIRTFGVGGLFGYFGKFYNRNVGAMTWYATRRSNYVLITTSSNKKIILTPDNPEDFVKEFYKI